MAERVELRGLPASPGIAVGRVLVYRRKKTSKRNSIEFDSEREAARFAEALEKTKEQVQKMREEAEREIGKDEAAIFEAHLMILEDEEFSGKIAKLIRESRISAEEAVGKVSEELIKTFESMESDYFRSRADDIKDLRNRILENLRGKSPTELKMTEPMIIAASELFPSDTVKMKKQKVIGLITEKGGVTSHAAIIARAMKIPAVVSVKGLLEKLEDGDLVLIDGSRGVVIISPSEDELEKYGKKNR